MTLTYRSNNETEKEKLKEKELEMQLPLDHYLSENSAIANLWAAVPVANPKICGGG